MAYRDSTTSTTATVTTPTVVADDIIFLFAAVDYTGTAFNEDHLPEGFLFCDEPTLFTFDGCTSMVAWKRATASEPASYTVGLSAAHMQVTCVTMSGRDWRAAFNIKATTVDADQGPSSPITVSANAIDAQANDDLLFIVFVDSAMPVGSTFALTAPSGYTLAEDFGLRDNQVAVAYKNAVSAGSTGTVSGSVAITTSGTITMAYSAVQIRLPVTGVAITEPNYITGLSVLDDFERSDGAVGSAWTVTDIGTVAAGAADVEGGKLISSRAPNNYADVVWNAGTYGPDCEVFTTMYQCFYDSDDAVGLFARCQATSGRFGGAYQLSIYRFASTVVMLAWAADSTPGGVLAGVLLPADNSRQIVLMDSGDKWKFRLIGSTLTGWLLRAGESVWTKVIERTDSTWTTAGYIGAYLSNSVYPIILKLEDFGGATFPTISSVAPNPFTDGQTGIVITGSFF